MMMNYIAFKSLRVTNDGVYSPQRNTKWDEVYAPFLGRLTYSLSAASLEGESRASMPPHLAKRRGIWRSTPVCSWSLPTRTPRPRSGQRGGALPAPS